MPKRKTVRTTKRLEQGFDFHVMRVLYAASSESPISRACWHISTRIVFCCACVYGRFSTISLVIVHYCIFGVIFIYILVSVYTVRSQQSFSRQYSITCELMAISILSLFDAYFMFYIRLSFLCVRFLYILFYFTYTFAHRWPLFSLSPLVVSFSIALYTRSLTLMLLWPCALFCR